MVTDYLPVYPPLRLDHLERLTDCTGVIQHAIYAVPDPTFGYSIDDQARALVVSLAQARLSGQQHAPARRLHLHVLPPPRFHPRAELPQLPLL